MKYDTDNQPFRLAAELVMHGSDNIFLTGKAGTGKTTFLKHVKETCNKNMAIVAPTGVAAINAGGVTIHSFFQLPLSTFIPSDTDLPGEGTINAYSLIRRQRINREKINVLQELELLIIDEISMVRCDTIDAIDTVLRHFRGKPKQPFGGVQVLFIGDMYQLPPVHNDAVWNVLAEFYKSAYFFDSRVLQEQPPIYIEFTRIYRQSEEQFIQVLNQVRNNCLDKDGVNILESRFRPSFKLTRDSGYIMLTTHNETARTTNEKYLAELGSPEIVFKATVEDDFPDKVYPAEQTLALKEGAQVMFIKNDSEKVKRFFNGKIGTVVELREDKIVVQCEGEKDNIEVKEERWENIRYVVDNSTRNLKAEVVGSFTQYPLRLAWAITIHKSQGLTFQKAVIDAGRAFAPGQVYVALSRCTNLEGLILQSRITPQSLSLDQKVVDFAARKISGEQLESVVELAKKLFEQKLLLGLFDFNIYLRGVTEFNEYLFEHDGSFSPGSMEWGKQLTEKIREIVQHANRFQEWILEQLNLETALSENDLLQRRVSDAAGYFTKQMESCIAQVQAAPLVTDSRTHAAVYNDFALTFLGMMSHKLYIMKGCIGKGFDMESLQQRKKSFLLPAFTINAYAGVAKQRVNSPHPQLYQQLRQLRDEICGKSGEPIYIVAGSKSLEEMAQYLPQSNDDLEKISGFGKIKVEKYGKRFLDLIRTYAEANGFESTVSEKSVDKKTPTVPKKKNAPPTKAVSFRLFSEGKTIEEIAEFRSLAVSTIESHLGEYIASGELRVEMLVPELTMETIRKAIVGDGTDTVGSLKKVLADSVSYRDIRWVLASVKATDNGGE